jgi:hypothetical protein
MVIIPLRQLTCLMEELGVLSIYKSDGRTWVVLKIIYTLASSYSAGKENGDKFKPRNFLNTLLLVSLSI